MRKPFFLLLIVFTAGMAIMAVEMSASRLLAPYFGTSLFVWTNLIGSTMIALTLGYYFGGKLADRYPKAQVLYWLLFAAGCYIVLIPFIAKPIMQFAVNAIDQRNVTVFLWSLIATVAQFFIPLVLLAMTAPFAIRICAREIRAMGTTAGKLYALGNVGSIIGTFLPALVTIPLIGTKRTIILCGLLLIVLSLIGLRKHLMHIATVGAVLLLFLGGPIKETAGLIFEDESVYNYIQVVENQGKHELVLNEGHAIHSVYDPNAVLVGGVWDYFLLFPQAKPDSQSALIIGLAGGTISRAYNEYYPQIAVTGVEIDPQILDIAKEYFGLQDQTALVSVAADGRTYLRKAQNHFDLIFIDAYKQPYIPFHLATKEFFEEVDMHLTPEGIAAINVGAVSADAEILTLLANTMASVFPVVQILEVPGSLNFIVFGSTTSYDLERLNIPHQELAALQQSIRGKITPAALDSEKTVFTDDLAPVEFYTEKMLMQYAAT